MSDIVLVEGLNQLNVQLTPVPIAPPTLSGKILAITWEKNGVIHPISEPIPANMLIVMRFGVRNTGSPARFKVCYSYYSPFFPEPQWACASSVFLESDTEGASSWEMNSGKAKTWTIDWVLFADDTQVDTMTVTFSVVVVPEPPPPETEWPYATPEEIANAPAYYAMIDGFIADTQAWLEKLHHVYAAATNPYLRDAALQFGWGAEAQLRMLQLQKDIMYARVNRTQSADWISGSIAQVHALQDVTVGYGENGSLDMQYWLSGYINPQDWLLAKEAGLVA